MISSFFLPRSSSKVNNNIDVDNNNNDDDDDDDEDHHQQQQHQHQQQQQQQQQQLLIVPTLPLVSIEVRTHRSHAQQHANDNDNNCYKIIPLTSNYSSWVIHIPNYMNMNNNTNNNINYNSTNNTIRHNNRSSLLFHELWKNHPTTFHPLVLFGKNVNENRYSQMYYHSLDNNNINNNDDFDFDFDHDETATIKKKKKNDGGGGGGGRGGTAIIDNSNSNSNNNNNNNSNCYYKYSGTSRLCLPCNRSKIDEKFIIHLCYAADQIISQLMMAVAEEEQKNNSNSSNKKQFFENIRLRIIHQKDSKNKDNNNNGYDIDNDNDNNNDTRKRKSRIYNSCLVNWYKPEHTIGLHSDDEPEMDTLTYPIISLSLGGPRRFVLKSKQQSKSKQSNQNQRQRQEQQNQQQNHEFILKDGDLFIMGGNCQKEYKHEVPKIRKTKDPFGTTASNRISWTLRRMKTKMQTQTQTQMQPIKSTKSFDSTKTATATATTIPNNAHVVSRATMCSSRPFIRNPYASSQQHKRQRR
jgi:alkylated DNA repair dioxygenase AlkB